MPELPEVETVARGLQASMKGQTIVGAEVFWPRAVVGSDPSDFVRRLAGQTVEGVGRRGKWVCMALSQGDTLLIHLRMTGRLLLHEGECPDKKHLRAQFALDDGRTLCFVDARKFGRLWLVDDLASALGGLGPEPLAEGFSAPWLQAALSGRRGRIKSLLLDQRFLAGLGNIYAEEALWRAGIHPWRTAHCLTAAETHRLHRAIRAVLEEAVGQQGTTLDDRGYVGPDGQPGAFAPRIAVYGHTGDPCPSCGTSITRILVGQRGTHFCPQCQPLAAAED